MNDATITAIDAMMGINTLKIEQLPIGVYLIPFSHIFLVIE
jgi:hypothetical protein